ncbi:conserved hypothetical protein [Verrucomicrobia bacterium]|nr:conserved hypothetical protein [Verrucomicrobiota bacterium]
MSLINDALKRAKQAQQQGEPPTTPSLQLRPAEPSLGTPQRGLGLALPLGFVIVAFLAVAFVWRTLQTDSSAIRVQAKTPTPVAPNPADVFEPLPPAPSPALTNVGAQASSPLATNASTGAPSTPGNAAPQAGVSDGAGSNAPVAVTVTEVPRPKPLRLQAIIYRPKHSSAVIGGRTLFVGDKIGDQRVVAIDQSSATLVGGGKTNVLELVQ